MHENKLNLPTCFTLLFWFFSLGGKAQTATVTGRIEDESGKRMPRVSVTILGQQQGIASSDSGTFTVKLKAGRATALVFSYAGYISQQRNFFLNDGENETINVRMLPGQSTLENVTISSEGSQRGQAGLISINPKLATVNPAPIAGIESLVKVIVGSNNELTSQYNVRGGSYDENLIYVNDFEIFRPYLIRNGQQEGLSFINPDLVRNVDFYNGGYQAKYGDKMSSVLDVQYNRPTRFGGTAYVGLLDQGAHLEGTAAKNKFTYLLGVRNRNLSNLLSAQETKGNYVPSSSDFQAQLGWQFKPGWQLEFLGNISGTKFTLEPEESQQTVSVFTPYYAANIGLDVQYEGREEDRFRTRMAGLALTRETKSGLKLKFLGSYLKNMEEENINIAGTYLLGERSVDQSSPDFGLIVNPLGAGEYLEYARNQLDIRVINIAVKGFLQKKLHYWQFGQAFENSDINDKLLEWEYQDSAGYSLPNNAGPLAIYSSIAANNQVNINRLSGFIQDNFRVEKWQGFTFQAGIRYNYNDLNKEMVISPRAGLSYTPLNWKRDVIFRGSAGMYHQPPFYREMRRYDGTLNTDLKAQRSYQFSGGMDYTFKWGSRPLRLTSELYYKGMTEVVPYDIDNVRLRYFGENMAKAYAYGLETRLNGELVKDAESWISFGLMRTMENLDGDFYYNYYNNNGELITGSTEDQIAVDSQQVNVGYLRRPTDRRINVGMFFSDYLTTNKNFKVYLQLLYGTNLPYNIPGSTKYRNALEIPAYLRADLGFSYQLLSDNKADRRSHHPLRGLGNMWIQLEVFNLLDRDNVISYQLIKDFSNNTYAIPNRLTPRLINLKLVTKW